MAQDWCVPRAFRFGLTLVVLPLTAACLVTGSPDPCPDDRSWRAHRFDRP
jgi:hypothetical protein